MPHFRGGEPNCDSGTIERGAPLTNVLTRCATLVLISAIAVHVGCGDRQTSSPAPPLSPGLAPQQSPAPKPPPPEPRETKVLPLDSRSCTTHDTTMIDFTSAQVMARCKNTDSTTRVLIAVMPRTTYSADYLRELSLRFCGDVIEASAPTGWKTTIDREKGRTEVAADVTWTLPEAEAQSTSQQAGRIDGFAVRLRGRWRRGVGYYVVFSESGGPAAASPHDCPYPSK